MKIIMGACILTLLSCGKESKPTEASQFPQQQEDQGIYRAVLTSVNPKISQNDSFGTSTVHIEGDEFNIRMDMIDTPKNVAHLQDIRMGKRCPVVTDDLNNDGYIDINEAKNAFGDTLIPLDGDLNSYEAENSFIPKANISGAYTYNESASLNQILRDLNYVSNQDLNLSGRHFVILGIPQTTTLPTSVTTLDGVSKHASLPIACGKIVRIESEDF